MYVLEITPQGCAEVFAEFGEPTNDDALLESDPQSIALVVFTGGADVNPRLYDQPCGRHTNYDPRRDHYEGKVFDLAFAAGLPMVGICRGAQFLCVQAGGELVQDVTGHNSTHDVRTSDDRTIQVTSSHHQMQIPPEGAVILATAHPRRSRCYLNGYNDDIPGGADEVEAAYYPGIRAVGVQWHPEWREDDHPCAEYARELVKAYLLGEEHEFGK